MSSRSNGVTNVLLIRAMMSCVSTSASCSTSLMALTCLCRFSGSLKSSWVIPDAALTRCEIAADIPKSTCSRGISCAQHSGVRIAFAHEHQEPYPTLGGAARAEGMQRPEARPAGTFGDYGGAEGRRQ